ncbi:MAG: hypothetical protein JNM77_08795 [Pseudonocardia sp.]|nr:hypothetical protein [Pseudonocardia sp.]
MSKPSPSPRHAAADDVEGVPAPVAAEDAPALPEPVVDVEVRPVLCNVPRCRHQPEWRGLCPAHRQTHRGLADAADPKVSR